MDVLFIDEVGQLSSQQFMQLDIILRHVRENNLPFGGVLILGKFAVIFTYALHSSHHCSLLTCSCLFTFLPLQVHSIMLSKEQFR